jgi:two-component system OmpR family sensor kinase
VRLGIRLRLLAAIVGAVAVALAVGVAAFNLLLEQRLSASAVGLAKAKAETELDSVRIRDGKLVAPSGPQEGSLPSTVWFYAGGRVVEAPRAPFRLHEAARALAAGPERSADVGDHTILYSLPVVQQGKRYGTVVSAVSREPYEQTARTALVGSLILAALLLGAVTILARWMLGRALLPVSHMTESAATWSEQDLDRRFAFGEPYDEVTRLGATLDGLLERIAASLRHEQRFTAEVSHELRTPLARIVGETELMLRRERTPDEYRVALAAVQRNAEQMTRIVDALVASARQEHGLTRETSDARDAVRNAVDAARDGNGAIDVRVSLPTRPVRVAVDGDLLVRMVQPLVENALRYGRSVVEVEVVPNGAAACVTVVDDGPGVAEDERETIFEPGLRGSAASRAAGGAGLGLSLARRLARSAGGDVTAAPSTAGGSFSLRLPFA